MRKAIILLNGTPAEKKNFSSILKEIAWVWDIDPRKYIRDKAKQFFYCNGDLSDIGKYVAEQLNLVNKHFDFERTYLTENIQRFVDDEDEVKTFGNRSFDKFVLVVNGVSAELLEFLKEEHGAFVVTVSRRDLNTNVESQDMILYSDEDSFSIEINKLIEVLTKEN